MWQSEGVQPIASGERFNPTAWQQSIADALGNWRRNLPDLVYKGPHRHPICPGKRFREVQRQKIVSIGKTVGMCDEATLFKDLKCERLISGQDQAQLFAPNRLGIEARMTCVLSHDN